MEHKIELMKGEKIVSVDGLDKDSERVVFECESGKIFTFFHEEDCCESVQLCDFDLEAGEIIGHTVLYAYESTNSGDDETTPRAQRPDKYSESWTWTFYRICTTGGTLCMRWLGESNGYYSERVEVEITKKEKA